MSDAEKLKEYKEALIEAYEVLEIFALHAKAQGWDSDDTPIADTVLKKGSSYLTCGAFKLAIEAKEKIEKMGLFEGPQRGGHDAHRPV